MANRSLNNDDIPGSKPKSFTSKKHIIKQQQISQIFTNPADISSLNDNLIGQYINLENKKTKQKLSPQKPYCLINNIFGVDMTKKPEEQKKNFFKKDDGVLKTIDSLDKLENDFQKKNFEFPKLDPVENPIEVHSCSLKFFYEYYVF